MSLGAANSEGVGDSIYIIEPRGDKGNLQNPAIIEAYCAQSDVILPAALRRILR